MAGQTLRGKVLVQTQCAIQSGVLVVHMDGKEKVGIRQLSDAGITSRAERQFYATRLSLRDFAVRPVTWSGTYEFPFAIALPACLPASTSHPRETRLQGLRIQYKLRIRFHDHSLDRFVPVRSAPLPSSLSPAMPEPTILPVRGGMLRQPRGSVTLGVHIPDTQVEVGGALQLRLACRNDSQIRVPGLRLRVVEECRWSSLRHEGRHKHILATLADVQLPELQGTGRGGKPPHPESAYREIYDSLIAGLNTVQIPIPAQTRASYQGQLVRISHWVEVQLQSSRSWASQPSQVIPIRVGEPRSQGPLPPQAVTPPSRATPGMGLPMAVVIEEDANGVPTNFNVPIVYAVSATDYDDHDDCTVLGGESVALEDLTSPHGTDAPDSLPTAPLSTLIPVPAPQRQNQSTPPLQRDVALTTLRRELAKSVGAWDLLHARLFDPAWKALLERLDPDEYGSLLSDAFVPDHDQVRLAQELARVLSRVGSFTCAHVAAALWTTSPHSRSTLLPTLLPLCGDLPDHRQLIEGELSVWERLVAGPEFDQTRVWCRQNRTASERCA